MRIRTALLAATVAALPVLAVAQTTAPVTQPPAAASPSATPDSATPNGTMSGKPHRDHAEWRKRHAEARAKYEQLSVADKAKFDDLGKQMKQLHEQRMQLLGLSKS
jgi:hypothetical protein